MVAIIQRRCWLVHKSKISGWTSQLGQYRAVAVRWQSQGWYEASSSWLGPKCGLFERSFNKFIQIFFILHQLNSWAKVLWQIDLANGLGPLEDYDVFTHFCKRWYQTDWRSFLVKNLPRYLGNINRVIHTVETAEIGRFCFVIDQSELWFYSFQIVYQCPLMDSFLP